MPLLVIIILLILAWFLYKLIYYRSNSFIELKNIQKTAMTLMIIFMN